MNLLLDEDAIEQYIHEYIDSQLKEEDAIDFKINNNIFEINVYDFFKEILRRKKCQQ